MSPFEYIEAALPGRAVYREAGVETRIAGMSDLTLSLAIDNPSSNQLDLDPDIDLLPCPVGRERGPIGVEAESEARSITQGEPYVSRALP